MVAVAMWNDQATTTQVKKYGCFRRFARISIGSRGICAFSRTGGGVAENRVGPRTNGNVRGITTSCVAGRCEHQATNLCRYARIDCYGYFNKRVRYRALALCPFAFVHASHCELRTGTRTSPRLRAILRYNHIILKNVYDLIFFLFLASRHIELMMFCFKFFHLSFSSFVLSGPGEPVQAVNYTGKV